MLIQSHTGIVRIFPAIPGNWEIIEFNKLRIEGAFLVSAKMKNRRVSMIEIESLKGGIMKLKNPFIDDNFSIDGSTYIMRNNLIILETDPGDKILLKESIMDN